ncbi:MAG: quinone-dependent dihydroorotate dehydrogenase [Candidatus Eisenbacteria bacterium]|nr:quinone-dependent dihydroorotate dehydrogenase [Candidatus Eisenbacteria bacterium]
MSRLYRSVVRPLFFRFDPERVHETVMGAMPLLPIRTPRARPRLRARVFGLDFPHPVGLAAGFDKEGRFPGALSRIGFGHIEVGTATPRPQEGNPKPRLFRVPEHEALVNRMGFNNPGAEKVGEHLRGLPARESRRYVVGANVGKQRETSLEDAAEDYIAAAIPFLSVADYLVVNISSPNTPGLRALETAEKLRPLLEAVRRAAEERAGAGKPPLLAKLSPDLSDDALGASAVAVRDAGFDGLVVTNTSVDLSPLGGGAPEGGGGLSGRPLAGRALDAVRIARSALAGAIPIIGVGGIFSGEDAYRRIRAGASLVQLYTGFIYEGPWMVRRLLRDLDRLLERDGFRNVAEAVGTERPGDRLSGS